jgi:predicted ABC-type ATPase
VGRPVLQVLAGVNRAGKSSIDGYLVERAGGTWFNPDTFARELAAAIGCNPETANAAAWAEGIRRLDQAVAGSRNFAFETTLGGATVTARLLAATASHEVRIWYCGLTSAELHIARVQARVAAGGHAIPEAKIRERFTRSRVNLLRLMPRLSHLLVFDNSVEADKAGKIPDPLQVLELDGGRLLYPAADDLEALRRTPEWAKPILESALRQTRSRK